MATAISSAEGGGRPSMYAGMKSALKSRPEAAASSRATPRCPRQSGRLGVISASKMASIGMYFASDSPGSPRSRSMIRGSLSSPSSSSSAEQSIPCAASPTIFPSRTRVPLGTRVPGSATGTMVPFTALGAPAMIWMTFPPPMSTWWIHSGLLERGWSFCSRTRPTTIAERSMTWTDSTLVPVIVSRCAASCGVMPPVSRYSPSHS